MIKSYDDYTVTGQMNLFDRDTWCGRMSLEHSAPAIPKERTSRPSSQRSSASSNRKLPMCLSLKRDGQTPGASTMTWGPGALLGEYTMRSFGEFPSVANESRLSQILEGSAPRKYYLSARACAGILNRAQRRGKALPEVLKAALENQILRSSCDAEN